ncbi:MAG: type VI secretion system lipoprotein TssJ [Luteimonas sp.]|nr:type VI secretion system lipoprotein TssJ [Luteimonas sp.]
MDTLAHAATTGPRGDQDEIEDDCLLQSAFPAHVSTCARRRAGAWLSLAAGLCLLAGCASTADAGPGLVGKALEKIGARKPADETVAPRVKNVPLRLHAGANLNSGHDGKPLAVVVRVYRLRDHERFERAPFSAFLDEDAEKAALGDDLIGASRSCCSRASGTPSSNACRLKPQRCMVALFTRRRQGRWRFSPDGTAAEKVARPSAFTPARSPPRARCCCRASRANCTASRVRDAEL